MYGRIDYRSFKVYRDIANLGYEKFDVADCIEQLIEPEFIKSIQYNDSSCDDVYICKKCLSKNVEILFANETIKYKGKDTPFSIEYSLCSNCAHEFVSSKQI